MKFEAKTPPRLFTVGAGPSAAVHADCGTITLEPGEQVTFSAPGGKEYDVARTEWGFYATPSINARLNGFALRTALVRNRQGRLYVLLVERDRMDAFVRFCRDDPHDVLAWLDDDGTVARIDAALAAPPPAADP